MVQTPFQSFCNHEIFIDLGCTVTSSADKSARKITKVLRSLRFQPEVELFKFVKYSWCYSLKKNGEISLCSLRWKFWKMGTFLTVS